MILVLRTPPILFIAQVAEKHQRTGSAKESLEVPDWSDRQTEHVQPVNRIANIAQYDLSKAVGMDVFGLESLDQHRQVGADKDQAGGKASHQLNRMGIHGNFISQALASVPPRSAGEARGRRNSPSCRWLFRPQSGRCRWRLR